MRGLIMKRLMSSTSRVSLPNFNTQHLAQGSTCPQINPNTMTLFNMRFCPYAQRSVLVLLSKQLDFDLINVKLNDKPDWFLAKNPDGTKVPVLEINGSILTESLVISEYLDEKFPQKKLFPTNMEAKARDKEYIELSKKMYGPMHKTIRASDEEELKEILDQVFSGMDIFEREITKRGTRFFLGNDYPGMLDYMIWPWFERLPIFLRFQPLPKDKFPAMIKWIENMKEDEAVKTYVIKVEDHGEFLMGLAQKTQNYDLLYDRENRAKL